LRIVRSGRVSTIIDHGMFPVTGTSSVGQLVSRARRRRISHAMLQGSAIACAVGLGGSVLLLITGTEIMNWYWPLLLFVGSGLALAGRARRMSLSDYEIAQDIDRRLNLRDSLSTALYFSTAPQARVGRADIVEQQRQAAEREAQAADLSLAIPFIAPRSLYVSGCLALMVFCLFAARYGISRSLDLHPSLVHIAFAGAPQDASASPAQESAPRRKATNRDDPGDTFDPALASDPAGPQGFTSNAALQPVQTALRPGAGSPGQVRVDPGESPEDAVGESAGAGNQGRDSAASNGDQRAAAAGLKPGDTDTGQPQAAGQSPSSQAENSSLMERMKDAMAGLLSKLKMQQNSPESRQSSARGANQSSGNSRTNGPGTQAQGKAQEGSLTPDGRPGANGETMRSTQSARGRSDEQSADSPGSPDSKSGIGRQDGSKDPRLAEQLAAMGKISEIIGRRSRAVTGELMVEVPSGKEQQLRTAYSGREAAHRDTAGEISRDEVPLMYQQYVQDYFEQIRKLPAPKPETRR
jgi:hypothetical protein